jgi:hypothetical protein
MVEPVAYARGGGIPPLPFEDALQETARLYREALWRETEAHVEIWCEKDALARMIYPVTAVYDVPLMVARGFSSETICFEAI